jgi:uncharacterized protein
MDLKIMSRLILRVMALAMLLGAAGGLQAQTNAPKKLLMVTVTKGWGHASIPTAVKVVAALAKQSGDFTLDSAGSDAELAAKMTPAALKNYDGVFFLSTTGPLPLPDLPGFLDWIKSGKGFIGAHSATDTLHGTAYIDMIGGEFVSHVETRVEVMNDDPKHPATRDFGKSWVLTDEIYSHSHFSRDQVHMLLSLDKLPGTDQPGFVPIAWCKNYGQGKVFFTALGHEDAVWESPQFQKHLLGGIRWALGIEPGDATPQTAAGK